jgi:hypothetical protein
MPLSVLVRNTAKRQAALDDLETVRKEVFGDVGDCPEPFADYDRASELAGMMRRAIETLRTTG